MATKRKRGNAWQYTIRRAGILPKPVYLTFESEAEGDARVAWIERQLDAGIVPPGLVVAQAPPKRLSVAEAITQFMSSSANPRQSDVDCLGVIKTRIGTQQVAGCDFEWAEKWVASMKESRLAPGTIRHHVGALARCLDWIVKRHPTLLPGNPLRALPKRYSSYRDDTPNAPTDVARERRLDPEEEREIRRILAGGKPEGRQRPMTLEHGDAVRLLFELALETAMRMREIFTLEVRQIDLPKRTVKLEKTKNGSKRNVPLTTVAVAALKDYLGARKLKRKELLLPFWSGKIDENGNPDAKELERTTSKLSRQYGRVFAAAGADGLRFHDLRHEATSRLFERTAMSEFKIAKITGHKDLRMLSRYTNLRASDLADELW